MTEIFHPLKCTPTFIFNTIFKKPFRYTPAQHENYFTYKYRIDRINGRMVGHNGNIMNYDSDTLIYIINK